MELVDIASGVQGNEIFGRRLSVVAVGLAHVCTRRPPSWLTLLSSLRIGRLVAAPLERVISSGVSRDIKANDDEEALMTRTLVDIDDGALAAAAAELGTTTKVETVNRALAEIAARPRRLTALERLRTAEDDLGDADVMRGAWR